jgi:anti-anti-sigma factor
MRRVVIPAAGAVADVPVLTANLRALAMTGFASFTLAFEGGVPLVTVKGEIDVNNVCAFKAVVECAEASGGPAIIVVLPSSDYTCASCYGILAGAYARLKAQNRALLLVCAPQAYPRRIIALLRLPFLIFDSVCEAIAELTRSRFDRSILLREKRAGQD